MWVCVGLIVLAEHFCHTDCRYALGSSNLPTFLNAELSSAAARLCNGRIPNLGLEQTIKPNPSRETVPLNNALFQKETEIFPPKLQPVQHSGKLCSLNNAPTSLLYFFLSWIHILRAHCKQTGIKTVKKFSLQIIFLPKCIAIVNTICAAYIGIGGMKIEDEPRH